LRSFLRQQGASISAPVRKQTSKRSDEGTIGRPQLRTLMLASQDRELVPQQHEFDVFRELGPPTPNEQLQNSRERKVSEGEQHRPILPGPANADLDTLTPTAFPERGSGGFWYPRARQPQRGET
jgi:hypothetical protein